MGDYIDTCIVVLKLILKGISYNNIKNKKLTFKSNAPFRSCILKINSSFIDNNQHLDIVMLMYNPLES